MTAPGGVSACVALGVRHMSCAVRGLAGQCCSLAQLGKVPCDKGSLSDALGTRGKFRSATREAQSREGGGGEADASTGAATWPGCPKASAGGYPSPSVPWSLRHQPAAWGHWVCQGLTHTVFSPCGSSTEQVLVLVSWGHHNK